MGEFGGRETKGQVWLYYSLERKLVSETNGLFLLKLIKNKSYNFIAFDQHETTY